MSNVLKRLPLVRHLKKLDGNRYHQLNSLRSEAETWLRYVPQTFPHFTDHTVRHCDAIVQQLGLILTDPASRKLVVAMNAVELHMLLAAAYLHDSGMVVPDSEKETILASQEWKNWTATTGKQAWETLENFRNGVQPEDPELRAFQADVQLRAMLATFIRKNHAARSRAQVHRFVESRIVGNGQSSQFWMGVAELCAGHGMSTVELADPIRFPLEKTVDTEPVAFRWLAILLRMGDLLDMDPSRSCATLQLAAGSLPPESRPHWTQYDRIFHTKVTPKRIDLWAKCETPEEHRLLLDWFRWIHEESQSARPLLVGQERHANWTAPWASLDQPDPTLKVEPGSSAQYIAHDWKLELDTSEILNRLVRNTYPTPEAVLGELLQNAADALRCAVSERLSERGESPPVDIRTVEASLLADYAIEVHCRNVPANDETLQLEKEYVELSVTDNGPGMSIDTIQRFLLQAGRSYYRSEDFAQRHRFPAASQFGIGFLSVMGVSNHVVATTRQRDMPTGLKLTLTGPDNYLLVERVQDVSVGTAVSLRLTDPQRRGWLRETVSHICRKLEFSVRVDDFGQMETFIAEDPTDFEADVQDVSEPGARFQVRSAHFEAEEISGELYYFVRVLQDGSEDYSCLKWARDSLRDSYPNATVPTLPEPALSVHGLTRPMSRGFHGVRMFGSRGVAARVDIRKSLAADDLQRNQLGAEIDAALQRIVVSEMCEHLHEHLQVRGSLLNGDWRYLQALVRQYELPIEWSDAQMPAVPAWVEGVCTLVKVQDLQSMDVFQSASGLFYRDALPVAMEEVSAGAACTVVGSDISALPDRWRSAILKSRTCVALERDGPVLIATWADIGQPSQFSTLYGGVSVVEFPAEMEGWLGVRVNKTSSDIFEHVVINGRTELGSWVWRLVQHEHAGGELPSGPLKSAILKLCKFVSYGDSPDALRDFFLRLAESHLIAPSLVPPDPRRDLEQHREVIRTHWEALRVGNSEQRHE